MGYAEDKTFSHKQIERTAAQVMEYTDERIQQGDAVAKFAYATPVSLDDGPDGRLRLGSEASHNDEQFNPRRVAGTVIQYLRSK